MLLAAQLTRDATAFRLQSASRAHHTKVLVEPGLIVGTLLVAYLGSRAAVMLLVRLPLHKRLLDHPDGARHLHSRAVPRLGGIAIFAGALVALGAATLVRAVAGSEATLPPLTMALVAASAVLFLVGLGDDLHGVRPLAKLVAQALAALIVVRAGFIIHTISLPPFEQLELGWAAVPITVIWLVGISNALNLVDGLDGLAGGVAVIALTASAASALVLGNSTLPWQTAVLIGALLGFLRYNVYPARIFLGDSGSLVVGFLVAVFAVKGGMRADGTLLAVVPLLALSYPLLDTGISIMRRWLRRQPLSRADGKHIHHQLLRLGLAPRQAALMIFIQSVALATLGLVASSAEPGATVAIVVVGAALLVVMLAYGAPRLQYYEFVVAGGSLISAARRARGIIRDKIHARDVMRVMNGAGTLEELQAVVSDCAVDFRFARMELMSTGPLSIAARRPPWFGDQPMWRLEYGIKDAGDGAAHQANRDALALIIWCPRSARERSAGGERVAEMLVPVIEQWLREHPLTVSDLSHDAAPLRLAVGAEPPEGTGERPTLSALS